LTTKVVTVHVAHHRLEHGVTVLEMKGSIHAGPDCRRVEEDVDHVIHAGHTRVIFDLSGVTHIDSAAIGTIVRCFSHLKKAGGMLRISGATGMVDGTLKMTQIHKVIEMYPTVSAAAVAFKPS
jgi:anti-sigma B factor antagonist